MTNSELIIKLSAIEAEIDALTIKEKNQLLPKLEAILVLFGKYLSPTFKEDTIREFSNTNSYFSIADKKENDEASWNLGKKNLKYRIEIIKIELKKENHGNFFDENLLMQLSSKTNPNFDFSKLIKFCYETNANYSQGNFLSALILLRAILNHIPPIFGSTAFQNLVTTYNINRRIGKNEIFDNLQNGMRKFGDFHNHDVIKRVEVLPSKNQIEPFKPSFEYLIQEIIKTV